jgi:AcrR family transcriptional regulator
MESATELFYARGVAATAVEDVAAAAALTKPTLYRHFPSKEALIAAYLDERHAQLTAEFHSRLDASPPTTRPHEVIEWLCETLSRPDFNGCAFVRAYAELHRDEWVREAARERKRVLFSTIEQACRAAGARDPSALAQQLSLIVEGATTMAFVSGDTATAADVARSLAQVALAAAGLDQE